MTRKPVDAATDANRALAVALVALLLLVVAAIGVTERNGRIPEAPTIKLSVSPLPAGPEPHRRSPPHRDASPGRKGDATTTTLRSVALGKDCLAAFQGKPAADRSAFPLITLPTLPPPETTTVPSTTAPSTTSLTTVPSTTSTSTTAPSAALSTTTSSVTTSTAGPPFATPSTVPTKREAPTATPTTKPARVRQSAAPPPGVAPVC